MTTITIMEKATVNAQGYKRNRNAKPVFNLTTGKIYSSVIDAADALDTNAGDVSNCCNGKLKHTKGNKLCFVKDIPAHLNEISTMISECSDIIAEREVEERRKKEIEKRQETLAKLKEKHSREKEKYNKMQDRANHAWREMAATESQIRRLENASLF